MVAGSAGPTGMKPIAPAPRRIAHRRGLSLDQGISRGQHIGPRGGLGSFEPFQWPDVNAIPDNDAHRPTTPIKQTGSGMWPVYTSCQPGVANQKQTRYRLHQQPLPVGNRRGLQSPAKPLSPPQQSRRSPRPRARCLCNEQKHIKEFQPGPPNDREPILLLFILWARLM